MAKNSKQSSEWQPFNRTGTKSRQYINTTTGEVISRRQFDQRYGRLAGQGPAAFERQAKSRKAFGIPAGARVSKKGDTTFVRLSRNVTPEQRKQIIAWQRANGGTAVRFVYRQGKGKNRKGATSFWRDMRTNANLVAAQNAADDAMIYDETDADGNIVETEYAASDMDFMAFAS